MEKIILMTIVFLILAMPTVIADVTNDTSFNEDGFFGNRVHFNSTHQFIYGVGDRFNCEKFKVHKAGNLTNIYPSFGSTGSPVSVIWSIHTAVPQVNDSVTAYKIKDITGGNTIIGGMIVAEDDEYVLCLKLATGIPRFELKDTILSTDYDYYVNHPEPERLDPATELGYYQGAFSGGTVIGMEYKTDFYGISPSYQYEDEDFNGKPQELVWTDVPLGGIAGQLFRVYEDFDVGEVKFFIKAKTGLEIGTVSIHCANESQAHCFDVDTKMGYTLFTQSVDPEVAPHSFDMSFADITLYAGEDYTLIFTCDSIDGSGSCNSTHNFELPVQRQEANRDKGSYDTNISCYTESLTQTCIAKGGDEPYYDMYFQLGLAGAFNESSVCLEWDIPYILRESYVGSLETCGWFTTHDIFWGGNLEINETMGHFVSYKNTDLLRESECKYVTLDTNLKVDYYEQDPAGYTGYTLYDSEIEPIATLLISGNNTYESIYYTQSGEAILLKNDANFTSVFRSLQIRLNLQADVYDIYYSGTQIGDNLQLPTQGYNAEDVNVVRIETKDGKVESGYVDIYCSDVNGIPVPFVDADDSPDIDEFDDREGETMCNLFLNEEISCTTNSDCPTDECSPNGKCNKFDMTYCDSKGYTRGNKCLWAGVTSCALISTGNLILDNFWLFLVFLLIMMFVVYIVIVFRGSKN